MNVTEYLLRDKDPQFPALLTLQGDHRYGELQQAAARIAQHLLRSGARKGDRAVLISDNSLFWVTAYLGILRAGVIAVPMTPSASGEYRRTVGEKVSARFAFIQSKHLGSIGESFPGAFNITDELVREISARPQTDSLTLPAIDDNEIAALMFTSGSTGEPRGVIVSHGNIIANTESIIESLSLTARDRIMVVLPFHYCFGTSLLHTHLRVGGSLVLDHRFLYPEKILERIRETSCTGFAGVPSHYQILLRRTSLSKSAFQRLRYVQQAGGHLAPAFVKELYDALPGTQVFVMYGQTEATARLTCLSPEMLLRKPGSIGRPIPRVKVWIGDEQGEALGPNITGEIVAEGANIAQGYWGAAEESDGTFRNGRLFTGDLGMMDEEGYLYVVGRRKDILKCGGVRVAARQVEETLLAFPGLVEAAVTPIHDDVLGEGVRAFIVPTESEVLDPESLRTELHTFCTKRLPASLLPKQIVILNSLPKNSSGKVDKSRLESVPENHPLQHSLR